jgi:hypothetical protein
MSARAKAAHALARHGLPVLPLWWALPNGMCACSPDPSQCKKRGKHPLGRLVHHGVKDATLDPRTIANWWRRAPEANIGIACGGAMRLLVVDVDADKSGEASLAALERQHGPLPETVEVVTPRGGRHIYLIVPQGRSLPTISVGKLGPGLDHRCQGGYVAAPPSVIRGKPYAWSVDSAKQFAEAPMWLLNLLETAGADSGRISPPEEWLALVTAGVEEGQRNHAVARLAGLLFRRLPEPSLAAELLACWNQVKCRPPLDVVESKRTLDSIADREIKRRGLLP